MQRQKINWRQELSIMAETGTGTDNGKISRKKRKIFKKYGVTNAREFAQLTETVKQKVQAKAQRIRRYKKRVTQYSQDKKFKVDKKNYSNLGYRTPRLRQKYSLTGSHCGLKKHSIMKEREWIRSEERRKISNMDCGPKQIMEITSFLSKAHNWKSPGNNQIQNYLLKAFPAAHRHITKNYSGIMEEPERVPDWLNTLIT